MQQVRCQSVSHSLQLFSGILVGTSHHLSHVSQVSPVAILAAVAHSAFVFKHLSLLALSSIQHSPVPCNTTVGTSRLCQKEVKNRNLLPSLVSAAPLLDIIFILFKLYLERSQHFDDRQMKETGFNEVPSLHPSKLQRVQVPRPIKRSSC